MKKIGIFYGSTTGTTESVAEQIASHLGVGSSEVYNVGNTDAKVAEEYELLILGVRPGDRENCRMIGMIFWNN